MDRADEAASGCPIDLDHFDHLAPEMGIRSEFHGALDALLASDELVRSDQHEGFWVASRYEDVLAVAQDWESFSSEHGITVPPRDTPLPAIPEQVDPPIHREFKRLINRYFTPAMVLEHEDATRDVVNRFIDGFIADGECDFMTDFANPLPGLVLFEHFLHAPPEELDDVNRLATKASKPNTPEAIDARRQMIRWIMEFAEKRRNEEPRGDVIDAILAAEIQGRPIEDLEVVGVIQILLFGGLDTTAGALGTTMMWFCNDPSIPARLREDPSRIPDAIEEVLRLDGPFAFICRRAMRDVEIRGKQIREGDMVLLSWAAANRDAAEFACPADFDLDRGPNRHIAFGAGPHRCAGSNLARMNLRVAIEEVLRRMPDIRLVGDSVPFHPGYSRTPTTMPIAFTPGTPEGTAG
jgi:cytochrome P450